MAKTREQKEKQLSALDSRVAGMKSAVIVDYKGLKVKDTEALRKTLRAKSVDFNVAKVSLARIALKNQGIELPEEIFKKPIAIAFGMEDETSAAKEIDTFAKKNDMIEILGGILENRFIDVAKVKQLAALPSKDEMRAIMVGTIAAPLTGMLNVLSGNLRGLVNVLNAHKEKIS